MSPPDFEQPGRGCRRPDSCRGPGSAGVGDYCETCVDNKCRRQAMEAAQKAKDVNWRSKTSRRKCKCAHDNIMGCKFPAQCAGFGPEAEGFCQSCENNPPATHSNPPPAPAYSYAQQIDQPYGDPSCFYPPSADPTTDHAQQVPYLQPGFFESPTLDHQATDTPSPLPASSDAAGPFATPPPCACQANGACRAGDACEKTIMFVEGDRCGMCTLFDCSQWSEWSQRNQGT
ncbi:hypothetical protein B0I37DRAFT_433511 [Chaetomium sp. MPI-CAGE-AT-0009]|nr:hypothetical protein B0I37DRAFT_433511 [Chaetomium sp. MPI-CAGE-AT-0009]